MAKNRRRRRTEEAGVTTLRQNRFWVLSGVIAAFVVLGALAIWVIMGQSHSPGQTTSSAQRVVPEVHDFEISAYTRQDLLGGDKVRFASLFDAGKPVVLNFWAGRCPPCRAEMPGFQNVFNDAGDTFVLMGVDVGPFTGLGSREDGRALVKELNITYPTGTTFDGSVLQDVRVQGMPTTVLFTPDGHIFRKWTGFLSAGELRSTLRDVLKVEVQ